MRLPGSPVPSPSRIAAAFWLALVLLLQGPAMAYQATAMATGIDVCSASGSKRVDGEGKPLTASHTSHHDCCCSAASLPPPLSIDTSLLAFGHETPADKLSAGRLGAEWMAPLSRGPPASGTDPQPIR
jgi:hypothetical protein